MRALNQSFPKIDNLEYFPEKVLLQIFALVGDIDSLGLAETSVRFEKIAKPVLNERYRNKYFTINNSMYESESKSERYKDFIELFGSEIASLDVTDTDTQAHGDNHWLKSLLNKMNRLKKLRLDVKSIAVNENLLEEHVDSSLTHLTLCSRHPLESSGFVLPKFRNLRTFALEGGNPSVLVESFNEVILNNPTLERLYIGNISIALYDSKLIEMFPFDKLMRFIGMNLKQLKGFAYVPFYILDYNVLRSSILDQHLLLETFVTSMKHLEFLALSSVAFRFTDRYELLRQLGSKCENIKHLELCLTTTDCGDNDLYTAIRSFARIESLTIAAPYIHHHSIVSLVEHLPFLRHLEINKNFYCRSVIDWSFVLTLLEKSQSLEKLTINSPNNQECIEIFGTVDFFNRFIGCMQMRNVKLEVIQKENIVGMITRNQVTWRNKLMHWVGYDPSRNLTNIHFMDLADQSTVNTAEQLSRPFNLVLEYLDLNSLQSLSRTNRKCSQLVESFVKEHSQQNRTFVITNEFFTHSNEEYKRLDMFTEYVTNLRINVLHAEVDELQNVLEQCYYQQNLTTLHVDAYFNLERRNFIVPQVRYFTFDGYLESYNQLYALLRGCPNLETIEVKRKRNFREIYDEKEIIPFELRKLKKFTVSDENRKQLQKLQAMLQNTNTELIIKNVPQRQQ